MKTICSRGEERESTAPREISNECAFLI